jgi:ferritin-like metal-binding protein YciE
VPSITFFDSCYFDRNTSGRLLALHVAAFEAHLEETRGQVERLEEVFASLEEKVRGKHCDGIAGIIEEGKSVMEEDFDDVTMDACLIASGQGAEHYEMAPQ